MSDKIREAQQKARAFARRSTTSSTAKAYVLGLCGLIDAALAQQPATVAVPAGLELITWAQAVERASALLDAEQERLSAEGYLMDSSDCVDVLRESVSAQPAAEQPAGTTSDQYRAELYDEVWEKARGMGYGDVTEALVALERIKAAEQPDTGKVRRELEAERNHFAIQAQRFYNERDTLRAEAADLKDKNEDLVFALSDAEQRANNAGRNASAFEDRMGNLQVANGKLVDEVADLKARLLEAERGNEELVRLRSGFADRRCGMIIVYDAGSSLRGAPGEVKQCPRSPHKSGADCPLCGGTGKRRICNLTACHEYGCQGSACYEAHSVVNEVEA